MTQRKALKIELCRKVLDGTIKLTYFIVKSDTGISWMKEYYIYTIKQEKQLIGADANRTEVKHLIRNLKNIISKMPGTAMKTSRVALNEEVLVSTMM